MPSRFQTMKCAASELLTTSTAWMLLAYSWPMRWKMRSPPERSTLTLMPGYLASNALAMRSATGRSTAVYQTPCLLSWPPSISSGVIVDGGGAAARARRRNEAVMPAAASHDQRPGRIACPISRVLP